MYNSEAVKDFIALLSEHYSDMYDMAGPSYDGRFIHEDDIESYYKRFVIRGEKRVLMSEITFDRAKLLLNEDCTDTLTLEDVIEALNTVAKATCDLGNALERKILGTYSFYEGQLNGINIALTLIHRLPKAKKMSAVLNYDDIEYDDTCTIEYFCSVCGQHEIYEEDHFCKNCGAYFEGETK